MRRVILALALTLLIAPAFAHKASDAYLTLERSGQALRGQWDIALRDLDNALGLDANGDGDITWGEVRARKRDIAAYAFAHLQVSSAGKLCALEPIGQLIDSHTDGTYAVLTFRGECPRASPTLSIDYRLFEGLDPQHRGLLNFVENGQSRSVVFSADAPHRIIGSDTGGPLTQFAIYLNEGVWHIWTGYDHILFLLSLLLPAVLIREGGAWQPGASFRQAFIDVTKVVTAFTVAHSITLTLAALSIVTLPSRLVESGIALSVVLAALNNLFPRVANGRWMAAFGFGLLHGLGFAGALHDLGLPAGSLALSLAGFNLGVEAGQLAIVSVYLPLAFSLRATWTYQRVVLGGGSAVTATVAMIWLLERALNVAIFSSLGARL
ncbi:HupE/UreJ family protein [Paraburkholderia sp. MMS20-SJTN17]|uniref:HupE/UreJ family protein n=1 Tax=Paraburkholderia translucens TaxID=2886945 RepID=A0ABS8KKL7_9BURK|nr:HupE/UreJ family protein [Paraburkholderia sp. MMS20-SJTN17]MCC8405272.1 HupE/UreJ family protein [Paraburkholderia sp. MMS20-SJTN17]